MRKDIEIQEYSMSLLVQVELQSKQQDYHDLRGWLSCRVTL